MKGTLYIVSAPSGAGKTSLVNALIETIPTVKVSTSHTTRPCRPGEQDGKHYHFIDQTTFLKLQGEGAFIEFAEVFGHYYGTSKEWVDSKLQSGVDVILEIDWQGAQQIRKSLPGAVGVFILPPSREALKDRLKSRGQDSEDIVAQRMKEAQAQISHYVEYDYIIVNDDFNLALEDFISIIKSRRLMQRHQSAALEPLLTNLMK